MSHERAWSSLVLLLVLALHLWLGWTLAHFHPDRRLATFLPRTPSPQPETFLVLTFSTRTDAKPKLLEPRAKTGANAPRDQDDRHSPASTAVESEAAAAGQETARAPLNLSSASSARPDAYRADILQHRSLLEHRATRFDHAWLSDGTIVDIAARRSMIAGALLGALGALTKPCTERQRINYDPACVPDQYIYRREGE